VASPGGLTERALVSFDDSGLQAAVERAVATVLGE
jgi:pyrroline-5-carboxylate reductase